MTINEYREQSKKDVGNGLQVIDKTFKEGVEPATGLKHIITRLVVSPDWFYHDNKGNLLQFGGKKSKATNWKSVGGTLVMHDTTASYLLDIAGISMMDKMTFDIRRARDQEFPQFNYISSISGDCTGKALTPSGVPRMKVAHVAYDVEVRVDEEVVSDLLKEGEMQDEWNYGKKTGNKIPYKCKYNTGDARRDSLLIVKRKLEISKHAENIASSKLYTKLFSKMIGIKAFRDGDVGAILYISKMAIDTDNALVKEQFINNLIGVDSPSKSLYGNGEGNTLKEIEFETIKEDNDIHGNPIVSETVSDEQTKEEPVFVSKETITNIFDGEVITDTLQTPQRELELFCESETLMVKGEPVYNFFSLLSKKENETVIVNKAISIVKSLENGLDRSEFIKGVLRLCIAIPEIKTYESARGKLADKIIDVATVGDLTPMEDTITACVSVLNKKRYTEAITR